MSDSPPRVRWDAVVQVAARQIREDGIGSLDLAEIAGELDVAP